MKNPKRSTPGELGPLALAFVGDRCARNFWCGSGWWSTTVCSEESSSPKGQISLGPVAKFREEQLLETFSTTRK